MFHIGTEQASAPSSQDAVETAVPFDFYTAYCETIAKVYGAKFCPTRENWDAMCKQPRARKLTADEFDDNYFSEESGDGTIY